MYGIGIAAVGRTAPEDAPNCEKARHCGAQTAPRMRLAALCLPVFMVKKRQQIAAVQLAE